MSLEMVSQKTPFTLVAGLGLGSPSALYSSHVRLGNVSWGHLVSLTLGGGGGLFGCEFLLAYAFAPVGILLFSYWWRGRPEAAPTWLEHLVGGIP